MGACDLTLLSPMLCSFNHFAPSHGVLSLFSITRYSAYILISPYHICTVVMVQSSMTNNYNLIIVAVADTVLTNFPLLVVDVTIVHT